MLAPFTCYGDFFCKSLQEIHVLKLLFTKLNYKEKIFVLCFLQEKITKIRQKYPILLILEKT